MAGLILGSAFVEAAVGLLTLFWLAFYLWVQKRYRYFEERGVPYLKPYFFFGNTFSALVARKTLANSFTEFYNQLGPSVKIGGVFQALKPTYIVKDPQLVNDILIKDFSHFHDRGFRVDEKTNPLEGHLFLLNGGKWRALRNRLSPTFTSGKLKWMFGQMEICADALVATIEKDADEGREIEIKDVLARFTTDVIGSCAFGYEPSAIKDADCQFRRIGRKIFQPSAGDVAKAVIRFGFPELFNRLKIRTVPRDIDDFFTSIIRQTFEHRRANPDDRRNDFVQLLLQLRDRGCIETDPKDYQDDDFTDLRVTKEEVAKIELTDEVLTAQAFVFFAAGFETTATSMSFALYMLAKHGEDQDRCRREIREAKGRHGGRITYEAIREMSYLDACFSETTRMYPPLGVLNRECTKGYVAADGTRIEKGCAVVVPVAAIHNDPDVHPEPDRFKPERFYGGRTTPHPGTFMPFGHGPRICVAKRFAMVEAKLGLAKILDGFVVTAGTKLVEPIRMNPRAFVLQPADGIWLNFEPIDGQQEAST